MPHFQILPGTSNRGPHSKEKFFVYIRERHKWLLDMGGERVLLYKRRYEGERCPLFDPVRKTNPQHGQDLVCYGTGFKGGYFKPIEVVVSLISGAPEDLIAEKSGRKRFYSPRSWTLWEPLLAPGDFIVRRNNQRLLVTQVYQHRWKHYVLHQTFETSEVERNSPIYQIS